MTMTQEVKKLNWPRIRKLKRDNYSSNDIGIKSKNFKITRKLVPCACGECGKQIWNLDKRGRPRRFKQGHRRKSGKYEYVRIKLPGHHRADVNGYVFEHIVNYENYHKCCVLPRIIVHHLDEDKRNNKPENLVLATRAEHRRLHRENTGQICKCGGTNIIKNGNNRRGKQQFLCRDCGVESILDKDKAWYNGKYGVHICGGYFIRCGIIRGKQRYRCNKCGFHMNKEKGRKYARIWKL